LPRGLPGHRILVSALLSAPVPRALIGGLIPALIIRALLSALVPHALTGRLVPAWSIGALLATLALCAALRSAAGTLLGLLCVSDAACRKERKRGKAGQQHLLSVSHQALSFPVG
jgi:hypothetical protein